MKNKIAYRRGKFIKYGTSTLASLILTALPSFSQTVSFSLATDTWNYSSGSPTTGFVNQTAPSAATNSSGFSTKSGLTVNFGATFVGTAVSGGSYSAGVAPVGSSMTSATGSQNPNGFLLSTTTNDSTGLPNGVNGGLTGSVTSYQRWYFEFSQEVYLDEFLMQDIDNQLTGLGELIFRDIVAAEAYLATGYVSAFPSNTFNSSLLPVAGSGVDPAYTLGSSLSTGSLTIGSESILAASPLFDTANPSSTPAVAAGINFNTINVATPIRAFSIYAISNINSVHRMALNNNSFQVTVVPEPSISLLGLISATGLLVRRRR